MGKLTTLVLGGLAAACLAAPIQAQQTAPARPAQPSVSVGTSATSPAPARAGQPPVRGGTPAPARAAPVPATPDMMMRVAITRDVIYGHKAGMALTYDVFIPSNANGTAVVNMISGGWTSAWAEPASRVRGYQDFLTRGITVIALHHGSQPQFAVPDAVADVRRGMRHIKMNARSYGIDPARIGVFGRSAGGHLSLVAAMMADDGDPKATDPLMRQENHVKTVVAWFPPTDMRLYVRPRPSDAPLRAPSALNFPADLAAGASPLLYVDAKDPPALIIHGDADTTVPIVHGRVMHEALDKAGVENVFTIYPRANHGYRVEGDDALTQAYIARANAATVEWFVKHL